MLSENIFLFFNSLKTKELFESTVKEGVLHQFSWRDAAKEKKKNSRHLTEIAYNNKEFAYRKRENTMWF